MSNDSLSKNQPVDFMEEEEEEEDTGSLPDIHSVRKGDDLSSDSAPPKLPFHINEKGEIVHDPIETKEMIGNTDRSDMEFYYNMKEAERQKRVNDVIMDDHNSPLGPVAGGLGAYAHLKNTIEMNRAASQIDKAESAHMLYLLHKKGRDYDWTEEYHGDNDSSDNDT